MTFYNIIFGMPESGTLGLGLGYPQVHYGESTWGKQKIVPALLSRALTIMEKDTQCTWTLPGPGPSLKASPSQRPT